MVFFYLGKKSLLSENNYVLHNTWTYLSKPVVTLVSVCSDEKFALRI